MSYNEIRPIFEKLWDFNQKFVPMDAEKGSKKQKSPEKERSTEKIVEEEAVTQEERKEVVKEPAAKRKEIFIISKYSVVRWSSKNYKIFTEMLRDFDRHDVEELYRLVKERYRDSSPEGYDLMLWGDLHTMFEPNEDDELWQNQHQYNLISWSLHDFCGIHMLLMDNGMAIHMLTEKKYPLSQEMISKMLKKRLEVDHESTQAIELLRFIRSQERISKKRTKNEAKTTKPDAEWKSMIKNKVKAKPNFLQSQIINPISEGIPAASHPPKRLRADYGTTGGSAVGGKSPSVLNRLLQDSLLTVEQGVPALPTLPFITSSVTASPLEEGGDHTDSVTGPSLRTVGPSARFVVLSDSSHHSGAKSADPEVDSFVRSVAPVMTTATTVTAFVSSVAATATTSVDVGKDKDVPAPSVFACSSSSDKTDRTLSLFTGKSGSEFVAGSIRAGGDADVDLQEIYIPEWSVTKGFELNDGRSCANMIDHFTPPAFFKTVRGMEHEQLFAEFNVSAARNLSLSYEVRMRAGYNILEKRKWKSLAEEKNNLLQVKDKEIEELRS
ncbi:hypothetical protein Tco_0996336 [Tanacetum coccineum]